MGTKAKSYIICADTYGKSCGPKVFYKLRDELASRGFKTYIFCFGKRKYNPDVFIDDITDEQRTNDIVVYPEIFEGNPLGFRNVVMQDSVFIDETQRMDYAGEINTQGIHSYFDFILNKLHRFGIKCLYLLSKSRKLRKLLKRGECYRWCNGYIFQIKKKIYDVQ